MKNQIILATLLMMCLFITSKAQNANAILTSPAVENALQGEAATVTVERGGETVVVENVAEIFLAEAQQAARAGEAVVVEAVRVGEATVAEGVQVVGEGANALENGLESLLGEVLAGTIVSVEDVSVIEEATAIGDQIRAAPGEVVVVTEVPEVITTTNPNVAVAQGDGGAGQPPAVPPTDASGQPSSGQTTGGQTNAPQATVGQAGTGQTSTAQTGTTTSTDTAQNPPPLSGSLYSISLSLIMSATLAYLVAC